MDIKHLEYFAEIINSDFNLTIASKKLMVSQPALSQIIKSFEYVENVQLFERYKGRLRSLTPSGDAFYKNALVLIEHYRNMMNELRESSTKIKGKIRIGMPPLFLGFDFSEIISSIIANNPEIDLKIIEYGAVNLGKELISKNLDLAVLIQPTGIESGLTNEFLLKESELTAFVSTSNPLARQNKLHWSDLNNRDLSIFDNTYAIHHRLIERFKAENIKPQKMTFSDNWNYLLMSVKKSDSITVFPSLIKNVFVLNDIAEIPFYDPILWKIAICQTKKKQYSQVEKFVLNTIIEYFRSICD
ncbi:MAG: LysR family transcriptional regulator [Defluviitaleaceae bacterium]|nr:LysR family transcriptional regulator [Defluviitaleaceae bacterium]